MRLAAGSKLGPYEILAPLGAGGMGEVYRARDTRLARDVALKVLPEALAHDPERRARFQREAQVLASLNHSNIAALYGLEESAGVLALVMELVAGPTLAERLKSGSIPLDDALPIAKQIAEALEAAHERGIVHRDLKPANIKVTPEGKVRVLDFGLAKALDTEVSASNISNSPTLTQAATQAGVILGTAAYMSPEQAKGKSVDRRADIWAFGCVLYEMLMGRQVFEGETVSDVLASVLKTEPDWAALPPALPPQIPNLVRRCLRKDPKARLQSIGDARIAIEEALSGAPEISEAGLPREAADGSRKPLLRWGPWMLAGSLAVALGLALLLALRRPAQMGPHPLKRFAIGLHATEGFAGLESLETPLLALSPDGKNLVYVGHQAATTMLVLRALDRLEETPIAGTEGASDPFFSPDSQWIGFFADGKLKKISIQGGAPITICDGPSDRGASWALDNTIVFSPTFTSGLLRVSVAGGAPQPIISPDPGKGERTYRWPQVLPDGKTALYTIGMAASPAYYDDAPIAVVSLETGRSHVVVQGASMARYVASGHLVYARAGALFAVPFDLRRGEVVGVAVPILGGVWGVPESGAAHFAVSDDGSLAYIPGRVQAEVGNLVWVDRKGNVQPLPVPAQSYLRPRLSPDGKRVAVGIGPAGGGDVWVYSLEGKTLTRLTFDGRYNYPVWSPDGKHVAFGTNKGLERIQWKAADGSAPGEPLSTGSVQQIPESWTPDGELLAFSQFGQGTRGDIWLLPVKGDRKPRPFLQTVANEYGPAFSPDGRWLAYVSEESGRNEVYVQTFPGPGGKWEVSTEGRDPVWSRNGRELFYRAANNFMVVSVEILPTFSAGQPRLLFQKNFAYARDLTSDFDVSPDGQRFLMIQNAAGESAPTQIDVVLNWFDELHRLAPTAKR